MELIPMNSTDTSRELASSEQGPSCKVKKDPDERLDILNSINVESTISFFRVNLNSNKKWSYIARFGCGLWICIVMAIAIVIVCLTTPKLRM